MPPEARTTRRWTSVLVALCLAASADAAPRTADDIVRPASTITLRLVVAASLPDDARVAMRREIDAIWRHEGYAVRWLDADDPAASAPEVLPVAILDHDRLPVHRGSEWPVAELVTDDAHREWAVTSLDAARRVVRAASREVEPRSLQRRRIGLVLGRSLAHEIGHYLLHRRDHASEGLMRARIAPQDLVALQRADFYLDDEATRWLREAATHRAATATAGLDDEQ